MNFLLTHYVSGAAFFSGLVLIMVSCVLSYVRNRVIKLYVSRLLAIVGVMNILISGTPLPLIVEFLIWPVFVGQIF